MRCGVRQELDPAPARANMASGQSEQEYLKSELGPEALDAVRALKAALDPQHIFNPGKIVPAA